VIICYLCGEKVISPAKFCPNCGQALPLKENVTPPPVQEPTRPIVAQNNPHQGNAEVNRMRFWPKADQWAIAAVLAIFPVAAILMFLIPRNSSQQPGVKQAQAGMVEAKMVSVGTVRLARDEIDGSSARWAHFTRVHDESRKSHLQDKVALTALSEIYKKGKVKHELLSKSYESNRQKALLTTFKSETSQEILSQAQLDQKIIQIKRSVTEKGLQGDLLTAVKQARSGQAALKKKAEAALVAGLKEKMNEFEGNGPGLVAVGEVKVSRTLFDYYFNGNGRYVSVWVTVLNDGSGTLHANPHNFTLSTTDGSTVSVASITYRYSKSFDAVNLSPGQRTSGWLAFESYKDSKYILTHRAFGSDPVEKILIP
jgi:hypothetical protein